MPAIHLLNNRNFIFVLAMAGGLAFPGPSEVTRYLMMPALAVAMTMATLNVPNNYLRDLRSHLVPFFAGILLTYVLLGGFLLAAAAFFLNDQNLWIGFVLIAAVPPAVAVIPFTSILQGNVSFTLSGTVASYLVALLVTPAIVGIFIGTGIADPWKLLYILILLIIVPLMASRALLHFNLHHRLAPVRGALTDWSFFIVVYSMIAVNRDLILGQPQILGPVIGIIFCATFVMGTAIRMTAQRLGAKAGTLPGLILLGTLKNQGIAGGLAIALFEKEAALPSAIYSVFMILYLMWLDWRQNRKSLKEKRICSDGCRPESLCLHQKEKSE